MNEKEMEVPQQEELSIRTGIKAGDDNGQMGTGNVVDTGMLGSGGRQGGAGS
jgi:hypothetical protein